MARGRKVTGDQQSEEFDELRRTVHTLLHMIENAKASLTAGVTAANVLNAWADAVATGKDDNPNAIANYVDSNREIVGVVPVPKRPARARQGTIDLDPDDKSV
jgi:hypothetical protein